MLKLIIPISTSLISVAMMFFPIASVNAEEYICSDKSGEDRPTFKRTGKTFIETITVEGENETHTHQIARENSEFIVLIQTFDYRDAMVTVIDKKDNEYSSNYLTWESNKKPEWNSSIGKCIKI